MASRIAPAVVSTITPLCKPREGALPAPITLNWLPVVCAMTTLIDVVPMSKPTVTPELFMRRAPLQFFLINYT